MKKVFLDCGTNLCQGLSKIGSLNGVDSSWVVYSFEANPYTFELSDKSAFPGVNFINKGVWSEDCTRSLSIETWPGSVQDGDNNFLINKDLKDGPIGGASNLLSDDWIKPDYIADHLIKKDVLEVECIDLPKFIMDNFDVNDYILMKLDIEGAEYPILEKMFQTGAIDYVNKMYVEWHQRLVKTQYDQNSIINSILKKGIVLENWY
jgi:FkbM family methyltransferase